MRARGLGRGLMAWGKFDDVGLATGEVYAIRWWNMHLSDDAEMPVQLHGAMGPWRRGANMAVCKSSFNRHDGKPAPVDECGCGMWAYWTPEASPLGGVDRVTGVIRGWGDTLLGSFGCRTQLAEIVALCVERVIQRADPDAAWPPMRAGYFGPPAGVHWGYEPGAMQTYLAMGGRPRTSEPTPDYSAPRPTVDDLASQSALEAMLSYSYGVPVYTTVAAMLALHPLTLDYYEPEVQPSAEEIIAALSQFGSAIAAWAERSGKALEAMANVAGEAANLLMPHTLSGAEALAKVNARMGAALDGDYGEETQRAQRLANE